MTREVRDAEVEGKRALEVERALEVTECEVELTAAEERDRVASGRSPVVATLKKSVIVGGRRGSCVSVG